MINWAILPSLSSNRTEIETDSKYLTSSTSSSPIPEARAASLSLHTTDPREHDGGFISPELQTQPRSWKIIKEVINSDSQNKSLKSNLVICKDESYLHIYTLSPASCKWGFFTETIKPGDLVSLRASHLLKPCSGLDFHYHHWCKKPTGTKVSVQLILRRQFPHKPRLKPKPPS